MHDFQAASAYRPDSTALVGTLGADFLAGGAPVTAASERRDVDIDGRRCMVSPCQRSIGLNAEGRGLDDCVGSLRLVMQSAHLAKKRDMHNAEQILHVFVLPWLYLRCHASVFAATRVHILPCWHACAYAGMLIPHRQVGDNAHVACFIDGPVTIH